MKKSKEIQDFIEAAREQEIYWVEQAKIDFAITLDAQRKKQGLSLTDIAKKIGTSAAYISKVFRGDTNFTIETMVKLARATGGKLDIKVVDQATATNYWIEKAPIKNHLKLISKSTVTSIGNTTENYKNFNESPVWEMRRAA